MCVLSLSLRSFRRPGFQATQFASSNEKVNVQIATFFSLSSPFFLHLLNLFKTGEILLCVGETKAFVHAVCNAVITVSEDLLLLSRNDRDKFALHRLPSRTMENRESFVLVIRNQLLSRRFLVFNMTLRILFSSRSRRRSRWFLTVESKGTFVKRRNEYISISQKIRLFR